MEKYKDKQDMKDPLIREVSEPSELHQVEELAAEIWKEHYTPIIGAEQVEYMLDNFQSVEAMGGQIREGMTYCLVYSDRNPVGYLAFKEQDEELFLSKIYVLSDQRGKGIGKAAMEFVESRAKDQGKHFLSLTVNKNNRGSITAYEKLGFVNQGPLETDIGGGFIMDDYLMIKVLRE